MSPLIELTQKAASLREFTELTQIPDGQSTGLAPAEIAVRLVLGTIFQGLE